MKLNSLILYFLCISILNSCIAYTTEDIQKRMTKKLSRFDSEKLDIEYETIYIQEGIFKCNKDLKIESERVESTSDGKFQNFMYAYKDGKIQFFGKNIFPDYEKYIEKPTGDFNAVFFQQNNKTKIERIQVYHSILGMDFGKGSYTENAKIENQRIIIKYDSGEHCDVYKPFIQ